MSVTMYKDRFAGQTAVITGGASGVGLALAERFTKEGAKVSIWDRDGEGLERGKQSTGAVHIQTVDVSDEAQDAQAAKASYEALGKRIDILVASAGITGPTTTLWEGSRPRTLA